jgi:hypothetical protein
MTPSIARYLHKTVFVAIPALFEDGACRPFILLGVELHGLWLQSAELTRRLLPRDQPGLADTPAAVFVPFAQIAGVLVGAGPAAGPSQKVEDAPAAAAPRGRTRATGGAAARKR